MSLPRFCKICRLILNYPDLNRSDYAADIAAFVGKGFCPDKHYEITLHEYEDDRVEVQYEKLSYNEYMIEFDYIRDKWVEIYKDNIIVLVTTLESWKDTNFRDKDYVMYKLDTLINFS